MATQASPKTPIKRTAVLPPPAQRSEHPWIAPTVAALIALPGLLSWSSGGVFVGNGTDLFSYQLPLRQTLAAMWAAGGVPLWNPYLLGGVPTLAGLQLGVLYPPNLLALWLSPVSGTEGLLWLHLAWLAAGGAVLARAWRPGLPKWACAAIGGWLALTGQTWGHLWAGHASFVAAWAWWPWVWALAIRFVDERRWRLVLAWGVALALQGLAGHPQVAFLCAVGLVGVLAVRAATADRTPPAGAAPWIARQLHVTAAAVGGGAAAAVAALLTLPQWLATAEIAPALNRTLSTPQEIATAYSAPADTLWTAIRPGPVGGAAGVPGDVGYHETLAFVGPAMIALAVIAVLRSRGRAVALLAVAAVCVALSLGSHGPLLPALADVVPGLGAFRVPARWLLVATALLALQGADALAPAQAPDGRALRWLGPALATLAVGHGLAFALPHLAGKARQPMDRVQWTAADRRALRQLVPSAHRLATAPALRMGNWGGLADVRVAGGYEPAITAGANRFGNALAGRSVDGYAVLFQTRKPGPWLDRMATSHLLLAANDAAAARSFAAWPVVATLPSGMQVRAHPAPRSRFEVANAVIVEPDPAAAVLRLRDVAADVVLTDRPLATGAAGKANLSVIKDVADHVELAVRVPAPAVVVVRDAWAPGWTATVDDRPAPTAIADGMFRAIAVPAGDHRVVWHYQPLGWPWACLVALGGWVAVAAGAWQLRRKRDP